MSSYFVQQTPHNLQKRDKVFILNLLRGRILNRNSDNLVRKIANTCIKLGYKSIHIRFWTSSDKVNICELLTFERNQ